MYFNYFVTVLAEMLKFRQHMCSCERYHMEISCKVDEYGAEGRVRLTPGSLQR